MARGGVCALAPREEGVAGAPAQATSADAAIAPDTIDACERLPLVRTAYPISRKSDVAKCPSKAKAVRIRRSVMRTKLDPTPADSGRADASRSTAAGRSGTC